MIMVFDLIAFFSIAFSFFYFYRAYRYIKEKADINGYIQYRYAFLFPNSFNQPGKKYVFFAICLLIISIIVESVKFIFI